MGEEATSEWEWRSIDPKEILEKYTDSTESRCGADPIALDGEVEMVLFVGSPAAGFFFFFILF